MSTAIAVPVRIERTHGGRVARVVLARPEVRNAFDDVLVRELQRAVRAVTADAAVRVVELSGEGKAFCAGADLNWMKRMAGFTMEENRRDAAELADLFRLLDECPKPIVGRIHGAALGGGVGLVAVCDVAVAAEETLFGTTEVRLGIIPAVISPYVVRKIGESHAREWFLTGSRHDAHEARRIGLVHIVAAETSLGSVSDGVIDALLAGGPQALAEAKKLAQTVGHLSPREQQALTVQRIAERRASAEGREGVTAFLEKRSPSWAEGPKDRKE
jgi:methylglutaconyl-CoA hydratase